MLLLRVSHPQDNVGASFSASSTIQPKMLVTQSNIVPSYDMLNGCFNAFRSPRWMILINSQMMMLTRRTISETNRSWKLYKILAFDVRRKMDPHSVDCNICGFTSIDLVFGMKVHQNFSDSISRGSESSIWKFTMWIPVGFLLVNQILKHPNRWLVGFCNKTSINLLRINWIHPKAFAKLVLYNYVLHHTSFLHQLLEPV